MDKGLIPRRYAKALYGVGADRGDNDALYSLMQALAASFAAEPALASTVANPFVSDDDKEALLTQASGAAAAGIPTFGDFLKLLRRNKRLDLAWDIARAYIDIYRSANDIYRVEVESAAPMPDEERRRLEAVVAKHIGKGTFEFDYKVNAALIGGFTVTVNSERLDASVATRLKQLRLHLLQ